MAESPASTEVLGPDDEGIERAAAILRAGGLIGLPTETVYGLAADAENDAAVGGIYSAKGRPSDQPLIVHILPGWGERYAAAWPAAAQRLAETFWPGPLTIVVPAGTRASRRVTGGLPTVGLRSPDHATALAVIEALGRGVAAPSANRYGHVSPTTAQHVIDDLDGAIDAVIDAGMCRVGVESTIVEIAPDGSCNLLRRGAITTEQILEVAAPASGQVADRTEGPVRAPGMTLSHYAPAAPVEIVTEAELTARLDQLDPTVLVISERQVDHPRSVVLTGDVEFAAGLYQALRLGDDPQVSLVLIVPPSSGSLTPAIRDRLQRAAHREGPATGR